MLITGGVQIDAKSSFGWTALHFAAKYNQSMILEMLLKNGASVEVQNSIGATPLHIATCQNSVEILIHMGAKIDAIDSYGQTPIYLSLVHKRFSIVSMLLKNGASLHTRNTAGLTLLESAFLFLAFWLICSKYKF